MLGLFQALMPKEAGFFDQVGQHARTLVDMDVDRKALFQTRRTRKGADPMAFIIGVDIYSYLEKAVDHFEDVANRISGIVIEQV